MAFDTAVTQTDEENGEWLTIERYLEMVCAGTLDGFGFGYPANADKKMDTCERLMGVREFLSPDIKFVFWYYN